MKKEFYIGQPLIVKETGKRVTCIYKDTSHLPYLCIDDGIEWYSPHDLEPSTEFKFYELIEGLEKGYFEAGTEFTNQSKDRILKVRIGKMGLYLDVLGVQAPSYLPSADISSTWTLVEPRKEMTLEEIEAELGYKIKLKDNGGN